VRTIIAARHCEIPDELRERAQALIDRLERVARRSEDARVIFDVEDGALTVEIRLHRGGRRLHSAVGSAPDHRTALDRAFAKLRRQLDKVPLRRSRTAVRKEA